MKSLKKNDELTQLINLSVYSFIHSIFQNESNNYKQVIPMPAALFKAGSIQCCSLYVQSAPMITSMSRFNPMQAALFKAGLIQCCSL